MPSARPTTLAELRSTGYEPKSVREELRGNLVASMRGGRPTLPGMVGYEDTVIPAVENAILAGHDMVFLGERGQGKSRMIRMLVDLLDEWIPVIEGSEVNDDPLAPISRYGRDIVESQGDETRVVWVHRSDRYGEKLATPDVTIADLLGEIDPIKVAEGRYLADELVLHYGLIPRTNRGIFCVNELPDLAERVQVGLFNVLEERDFQIKGFKVRLPLDVLVVASANPEDYTRRGRIITPLKDRYQAQIRTHYPKTRALELDVMEQEATRGVQPFGDVHVPAFLKDIVAEVTLQARESPDINQASGVSVRTSISNLQTLVASAERRALRGDEPEVVPRLSDLQALSTSTLGKIELEYAGADVDPSEIFERLLRRATKIVFDECVLLDDLKPLIDSFEEGWKVEVGPTLPSREYVDGVENIRGLADAVERLGESGSPGRIASAMEFLLEGLHLSNKLNKDVQGQRILYR